MQPQAGVKYHLVKNDVVQRDSAYGEGESLVVAQVSEPGNYKVMAGYPMPVRLCLTAIERRFESETGIACD